MQKKPDHLLSTNGYDPIVAIATAPGKGGVGVIRLSTSSQATAHFFLQQLLGSVPTPRMAKRLWFKDAQGRPIDDGLLLYFPAPQSFTAEHVIELQGHGGPAVLRAMVERLLELGSDHGIRLARAGEFTERAFLNDKLDLAQAEAVADLIDASSVTAAKAAANSLSGEFSRRVDGLADELVHLRLLVEATLDFPEEEIEFLEKAGAREMLDTCQSKLQQLLSQARQGAQLREGLTLVLAGQPNVGKSSLLNALAGQDVSIVTAVAGTTRDRIAQSLEIDGIALTVIDTAGLRFAQDEVEQIGIDRTRQSLRDADMVLHVLDASQVPLNADSVDWSVVDPEVVEYFPHGIPVIRILNKVDIHPMHGEITTENVIAVSAKAGQGMDKLRQTILTVVGIQPGQDFAFLARQRHLEALKKAQEHLLMAVGHAQQKDRVLDLFAEELRLAHDALGEITGRMLPDDLLGLIFSRFCIGK